MLFLRWKRCIVGSLLIAISQCSQAAIDLRGSVGLETRAFTELDFVQSSLAIETEWYWESGDSSIAWKFKPFARLDSRDDERTHADLREFFFQYANQRWEFRAGINKVFWGVTESQHLVDVINQTDYLEGFDGEDKLGQPMLQLTSVNDWGVIDAFLLPYFRERKFPGQDGGFNYQLTLDTATGVQTFDAHWLDAEYESSQENKHVDTAFRYSHFIGPVDVGISYFSGTARDPLLTIAKIDQQKQTAHWSQTYLQMTQWGISLQATLGVWLLKLEAIERDWKAGNYSALSAGFEYTIYGLSEQGADLGLLLEWNHDSRGDQATNPNQNDLFSGLRYSFNNPQSSEILMGVSTDLDNRRSYMGKVEASHRLGDSYRVSIDAWFFNSDDVADPVYLFAEQNFIQLSLEKFF